MHSEAPVVWRVQTLIRRGFRLLENHHHFSVTCLEPQTTIYKWMEMVISNHFLYKDLVHHPTETSIYKWLALGFQGGNLHIFYDGSFSFPDVPTRQDPRFHVDIYISHQYPGALDVWPMKTYIWVV